MADPNSYPPAPFGNLFDFNNPQTTALLGALQGLGAAAQTSRLPVTTGSVFGSLAGGLLSGAAEGAKMRGLTGATVGQNIANQNALNQLGLEQQFTYGQEPSTPEDLLAGHLRQLDLRQLFQQQPNLPAPAFGSIGQSTPQLTPSTDQPADEQPVDTPAHLGTVRGQKASFGGPAPQFSLADARALTARYESGNKPFVGYSPDGKGVDLSQAPIDQTGAPIWEGAEGPQGRTHAFGLYQFEPKTWATYAPMLNIKDWRQPGAQDAVFNLAYLNEGTRPWQDNNKLIAALSGRTGTPQQNTQIAAQQSPPNVEAQLTTQDQPGGAGPVGVPGSIGGAGVTGSPALLARMLANPALRDMRLLSKLWPGAIPPQVQSLQFANLYPPGSPQRATFALDAAKALGIPATKGGERPNAPLLKLDLERFIQTGQAHYDVDEPAGYNKAVYNRALAEVTARGTIEEQKFIDPNTGAGYATNRTVLQSGNPLPINLAPGDVETQTKQAEANVKYGLRPPPALTPAARAYRDYFNQSGGGAPTMAPGGGATPPPAAAPGLAAPGPIGAPFGGAPPALAPGGVATPPSGGAPGLASPGPIGAPFGIGGHAAAPNVTPSPPGASAAAPPQPVGAPAGMEGTPLATRPPAPGLIRYGLDPASNKPVYPNIPDISQQILPASPEDYKAAIPLWQKDQQEYAEMIDPATRAIERFETQADIYKSLQTGAWATEKAQLFARLKSLGIPLSDKRLDTVAGIESALHENYNGTLDTLKSANNRFTQREFQTISQYSANPNLQPKTNAQLLAESIGFLRRDVALAQGWQTAARQGWRNTTSYETQFLAANPLPPIVNAVAQEIGPLAGMQPTPGGGAPFSPGGPSERPAPGTTSSASPAPRNARPVLREGATATGPGGHQIKVVNGGWVDLTTGQPFDFAKIPPR